ncbi:MAG TPA: nuclear transport factor 2 family protein [Thermoanaerobaculia bacterium]|nr:nuclear transport factor 2 family protein [Thermoanaerobaculia bacterium]
MKPNQAEALLRSAYTAFNARDIETALGLMHPDVDWPNGMEGGRVQGHAGIREYWTRQFKLINSQVNPQSFRVEDDGRIAVLVHQVVHDPEGKLLSDSHVEHVYRIEEGLVSHMEIRDTTAQTLAGRHP